MPKHILLDLIRERLEERQQPAGVEAESEDGFQHKGGLLNFLSGAEEYLRDGCVEAAELVEVFEIVVHI